MSEHVLEWLPAYHDGELSQTRKRRVDLHLQECGACRAELEALQGLSALLRRDPAPQHTPPERFAAQVQLLLPHRKPAQRSPAGPPRWVLGAPLLLIVAWGFLQAALQLSAWALAADWLFPGNALFAWLGADSTLDIIATLSTLNLALLAGAVILWASWLAFWWAWKQNQNLEVPFNRLEKEV